MDYISLEMEDYGAYGVGRDDGKNSGEIMAILWNRKQVSCERMETFWLSPTPDQVSLGWDAGYKRTATWGEFTVLATKQKFFYLNTHVDNEGNLARVQSIALIKEKVKELNPYGFPVIITGDFNAGLEHAMFEPFGEWLFDARSTAPVTDTKPTYHGFGKYSTKIDHIFYCGLEPLEYETVTKTYEGVTYISDHYPITALFELKGSANPDDPQAPGNYGDLTEEDFPLNDYNEPPYSDGGYGDLKEEDYPLQ
jgi:endonuclease/exonuclease/phosphatase family metal-dependent hydrolase